MIGSKTSQCTFYYIILNTEVYGWISFLKVKIDFNIKWFLKCKIDMCVKSWNGGLTVVVMYILSKMVLPLK